MYECMIHITCHAGVRLGQYYDNCEERHSEGRVRLREPPSPLAHRRLQPTIACLPQPWAVAELRIDPAH